MSADGRARAGASAIDVPATILAPMDLVDQLNTELQRTTTKLAPIPAQGNLIPAPGGN